MPLAHISRIIVRKSCACGSYARIAGGRDRRGALSPHTDERGTSRVRRLRWAVDRFMRAEPRRLGEGASYSWPALNSERSPGRPASPPWSIPWSPTAWRTPRG